MRFDAHSLAELERQLTVHFRPVPPRDEGRTKYHTEPWVACCALLTLARAGKTQFPQSIEWADKPDIRVAGPDLKQGIEITEMVSEVLARAEVLAAREFPEANLQSDVFVRLPLDTTSETLRQLIRNPPRSGGWSGDKAETFWAEFLGGVLAKKLERVKDPESEFKLFNRNSLLVYDNLLHLDLNLSHALALFSAATPESAPFDEIFVLSGKRFACWSPRAVSILAAAKPSTT